MFTQQTTRIALQWRLLFGTLCAIGFNSVLLWFLHNQFWYPPDEGNYAHVAQRLLNGEVLNLQIQDIHPGYINFVNAAAFKLFGTDLLSLRYPLVFMAFTQAILIFVMFYRSGRRSLAAVAAISVNALGLVHFLNPTSNWYSLFLVVLIACSLVWLPRDSRMRVLVIGFLLGTLVLFRQLSGVLVGMGVITCLLLETDALANSDRLRRTILARALIAIMAIGLAGYLLKNTDLIGFVLFGLCPLLLLLWLFIKTTAGNSHVARILAHLAIGGIVASLPLVFYHLLHGSLHAWLNDTVISAIGLIKLPFMNQRFYGALITAGISQLFRPGSLAGRLNGLYWTVLPLLAFVNGVVLLRLLTRNSVFGKNTAYVIPVLAIFYAVVSVHYQIAIYLYYTVGLSLVGLLWLTSIRQSRLQYAVVALAILLSGIAVYYHAGQPLSGRFADLFGVRNIASLSYAESSLPRASLKISEEDKTNYTQILNVIESETQADESIFAIPTNAELYFLSARRNPFRFYNTALGIRTPADLELVKQTIITAPPKLVLYRADDKYNTGYSRELMRLIAERYDFLGELSGFAVYRSR